MDLQQSSTRWRVWFLVCRNVGTRSVRSSLLFWLLVQALVSSLCLQEASSFVLRKASFVAYKVVALFVPHRVFALFLSHRVFALFLWTVSFLKDVWTNTRVLSRSGGSYKMSEFRQDYLRNYTIPSHPLATYILTRQDTRSKLSEGDGDKIVRNERKRFSSSRFNSLLFNIIGS